MNELHPLSMEYFNDILEISKKINRAPPTNQFIIREMIKELLMFEVDQITEEISRLLKQKAFI